MNLTTLLQRGYFPKELPPPFETKDFAKKSKFIKSNWNKLLSEKQIPKNGESNREAKRRFNDDYTAKYGSSQQTIFSLGKGLFSRRKLSIPHPKQYLVKP